MKLYEPEKETSLKEMICSELEFRKYKKRRRRRQVCMTLQI